ncbi:MAG: GyrI-like domain-containing protein [Chloroflexota bacterium]|nr:GyrI-like domain-containing protein [Chloroflexota bacterium]
MPEISIKQLEPRPTAVIRTTVETPKLAAVFDDLFPATWQAVQEAGRTPAGPPFGRYFDYSDTMVDLEAGVPLDAPIAPAGRVTPSSLPGGEAVCLVHIGPYTTMGAAHDALEVWMAENGRHAAGPVWESYVTDPSGEPDSSKWRTEIIQPVVPLSTTGATD